MDECIFFSNFFLFTFMMVEKEKDLVLENVSDYLFFKIFIY